MSNTSALIYVGETRTTEGRIYIFSFLRNEPQHCKHPGCIKVLAASNKFGLCRSHNRSREGRAFCRVSC